MAYAYKPPKNIDHPNVARARILDEFRKWNAGRDKPVVTDYDLPMLRPGVTKAEIVFLLRGVRVPVLVDRWGEFATNLHMAALAIQSMRLNEERGLEGTLRDAYAALPPPSGAATSKIHERDPYDVLQVAPGADREIVDAAFRASSRRAFADGGGPVNPERDRLMTEINNAKARIYELRGWTSEAIVNG